MCPINSHSQIDFPPPITISNQTRKQEGKKGTQKKSKSLFRSAMAPAIAKAPKEAKPKKTTMTTAAPKKPRAHPTYYEMISEAITALKERTGSSQVAIAKFIEEKQKANLPVNFKKLLLVQLKKLVANGKLVKVKNSFKLPPKSSSATTATAAKKLKAPSTKAAPQKTKSSSTTTAPKKTKPASAKAGAKKVKPASTTAAKKRKAADAGVAAKKAKTDGKKAVAATKAKKPKTIKSPAKKVVAKKAKK